MIARYVADMMTKPGRSPVFGSPADFGLPYQDVTFHASGGVSLSGWLVEGASDKVIIQTHFGIQSSRSGFTPKGKGLIKAWPEDIVYLRHVKHLVDAGYTVLMYDLRNHGDSGPGTVPWIAGGMEEYRDVIGAVDFINSHPEYESARIGLLSFCMGANSSTYAYAAHGGLSRRTNIEALVAVQPLSFEVFMRGFGVPGFLLARANKVNMLRGGTDFRADPLPFARTIKAPTLLVQNRNDPWTELDWVESYFENLTAEKEMFWIDGPKKRLAAYEYFGSHPEKMLEWFGNYL